MFWIMTKDGWTLIGSMSEALPAVKWWRGEFSKLRRNSVNDKLIDQFDKITGDETASQHL